MWGRSGLHVARGADAAGGTCPDWVSRAAAQGIATGETSRRPAEAWSPRSHRPRRATFRGHEQPGPAPARMWPAAVKCPARLGVPAPVRRGTGDDPATHPEAGLLLAHGPCAQASRMRAHASANPSQGPALLSARPRDLHQRGSSRYAAGPGGRQLAATRDKSRSYVPGPPVPNGPPGRAGPYSAAAILKRARNTMSGRSGSVVYGVTVGKRQRNPLMGNMKRSRRTLKWPAGFS